ncbi:hypothetical protein WN943_029213 [Citrus x changshan-huyou]
MEQFTFRKEITYTPSLTSLTRRRERNSIEVRPVEKIAEKKVSKKKLEEDDDCRANLDLIRATITDHGETILHLAAVGKHLQGSSGEDAVKKRGLIEYLGKDHATPLCK